MTSVTPGGPAAAAGFAFGTEILSVDGVPVDEILAQPLRTLEFPGTPEAKRINQVGYLLKRAAGTEVEVGYQQPGATEVMTTVLTAVPDIPKQAEDSLMPLEYKLVDGVGYVSWPAFERTGIATHIFADFVKVMNETPDSGHHHRSARQRRRLHLHAVCDHVLPLRRGQAVDLWRRRQLHVQPTGR